MPGAQRHSAFSPVVPECFTLSARPTKVTRPMTSQAELSDKLSNSDLRDVENKEETVSVQLEAAEMKFYNKINPSNCV